MDILRSRMFEGQGYNYLCTMYIHIYKLYIISLCIRIQYIQTYYLKIECAHPREYIGLWSLMWGERVGKTW